MAAKASPKDCLRCHQCTGPLSKDMETSGWNLPPRIRDSFSMIGSALGGTASAFYGFNRVMPFVHRWVKGPMWLHFLIGAPPVIVFSSVWSGLTGGCSASNGSARLFIESCCHIITFASLYSRRQDAYIKSY